MKKGSVICFLPCRKGSERVPKKNIKSFNGNDFGLIEIKLQQLLKTNNIDEIVLSTNDEEILNYASSLNNSRLRLYHRNEALSSSSTSTDQLVAHALQLIPQGHILWTHVTSPFITSDIYEDIIQRYFEKLNTGYDSLMTTTLLHSFLWQDEKPLNYDRNIEKWPRTQSLKPIHDVNSAAFLASTEIYSKYSDRIGLRPYLLALNKLISHDVDWPEDFVLGESMLKAKLVQI